MPPVITSYGALGIAIVFEVIGTSMLPFTQQFSRLAPTLFMAVCYAIAFYGLTIVIKTLPVSVVYAMWGGLGITLITAVDYFVFRQALDAWAIFGIGLIVSGVIVINVLSKTVPH